MKKVTLSTYINRNNTEAGKLLHRARNVMKAMPTKVGLNLAKEIEDYLGLNIITDETGN